MNYYAKGIDILFDLMKCCKHDPLQLIKEIVKLNPAVVIRAMKNVSIPWEKEVIAILKTGKKIPAIKRCRELTGLGLQQAKDAVDELAEKFK